MDQKIQYFGTNLDSAGHYFFTITEHGMYDKGLDFKSVPFNPENLIVHPREHYLPLGTVVWLNQDGYVICAIEGSCSDNRRNSHSVFWVKEDITCTELMNRILNHPIASKIIEKMPFEVKWGIETVEPAKNTKEGTAIEQHIKWLGKKLKECQPMAPAIPFIQMAINQAKSMLPAEKEQLNEAHIAGLHRKTFESFYDKLKQNK